MEFPLSSHNPISPRKPLSRQTLKEMHVYVCPDIFCCNIPSNTRLSGPSKCPPVLSGSHQKGASTVSLNLSVGCVSIRQPLRFPFSRFSCVCCSRKLGKVNRRQTPKSMPWVLSPILFFFFLNFAQPFEACLLTCTDLYPRGLELLLSTTARPIRNLSHSVSISTVNLPSNKIRHWTAVGSWWGPSVARVQVVHMPHGHAHRLQHAWSVAQQLHLVRVAAQGLEVGLGAGVHREEPAGAGASGEGDPSSACTSKLPILVRQSWDAEFQAELGKGPPAHCVPATLCHWGPQGCSAYILSLKTSLPNGPISFSAKTSCRGLKFSLGVKWKGRCSSLSLLFSVFSASAHPHKQKSLPSCPLSSKSLY